MVKTRLQLQEKLVLFWHDHFATSYAKVGDVDLMRNQNRLLRRQLQGQLPRLRQGDQQGRRDDGVPRHGAQPQEASRTRTTRASCRSCSPSASSDPLGNANYEQEDIVQIARAFTGWDYDGKGDAELHDGRHDYGDAIDTGARRAARR